MWKPQIADRIENILDMLLGLNEDTDLEIPILNL